MNQFMGLPRAIKNGTSLSSPAHLLMGIHYPFSSATQMHAYRHEVLELCRTFDTHIAAGLPLNERDARAVKMLRMFRTRVMPDSVGGRLLMQKDGTLWRRDAARPGYWVMVDPGRRKDLTHSTPEAS
jgi:hypothetical protein